MMAKQSRAIAVTEHDNKCPECLHLEILGEPLALESKGLFSLLKKSDPEAFYLSVRIIFNQQWLVFRVGRVKWGVGGGVVRVLR
ncbi:MAG: hypothetical protein ACK5U2_11695, partial [Microcystis sp.]